MTFQYHLAASRSIELIDGLAYDTALVAVTKNRPHTDFMNEPIIRLITTTDGATLADGSTSSCNEVTTITAHRLRTYT